MTPRLRPPHSVLMLALFVLLSIGWTWPLATQISSRVAFDRGDPFLNTWILWWNAQAVPFTEEWWNPPIFYPMRGALALSEHLAGIGLFTTPIFLLGGTPALAYNVALLSSYALSGFFTWLLVRRLTGSTIAAFCAGLAFGFAPFRAGQLSHLQVLTAQWLPLQLLGLHAYMDSGRRRWLVVFGAAFVVQGLSNGYYLLFAPVLLALWAGWFVVGQRRWREGVEILCAGAVASLALLPAVLGYLQVHTALGLVRGRAEIAQFNAGLQSFLNPPPMLAVWPPRDVPVAEDFLFPGVTIVLVVGAAVLATLFRRADDPAARRRTVLAFYSAAAVCMAALTFGPSAPDAGVTGWLRPYEWLVHLPGFSGLRVPVRFAMLMALCLAVCGGAGLALLLPAHRTWRALAGAIVAIGIALDGMLEPMPVSRPAGRVELPDIPAAAVLELPPDDIGVSVGAMFRSMHHRRPLINGYSGHIPPHYAILGASLRRDDPTAVLELARGRTLLILLAERNDPAGDYRRLVESIPGVQRGALSGAGMTYVLPAQPRDQHPSGGTRYPFLVTRLPRRHAVLDLAAPRVVRSFEFLLRDRYPELGRRVAIEAWADDNRWQTVWEDWTGGAALAGALQDPITVPVRFLLPDITARYLRVHPAEDWMLQELSIRGP